MTYTSPTPASDSRQRGKLRASLRTGTITLTGSTCTAALNCDTSASDFVPIILVSISPFRRQVDSLTMLAELKAFLNARSLLPIAGGDHLRNTIPARDALPDRRNRCPSQVLLVPALHTIPALVGRDERIVGQPPASNLLVIILGRQPGEHFTGLSPVTEIRHQDALGSVEVTL